MADGEVVQNPSLNGGGGCRGGLRLRVNSIYISCVALPEQSLGGGGGT